MFYRQCSGGHDPYVETQKEHEVFGERAKFNVWHVYEGTYPDGCKASESHKYVLTVDGQHLADAIFDPKYNPGQRFWTLKEIAEAMNERERQEV
jgi:hypothetical protein